MARPRVEDPTTARPQPSDATSSQATQGPLAIQGSRFARRSNAQEDTQRQVRHQSLRPLAKETSNDDVTARPRTGQNPKRNSPEGGLWGRASHGRQFTVGSIGNNGRIYLRPVVRPGNQRSNAPPLQSPFSFPPDTLPDDTNVQTARRRPVSSIGPESFFSSAFTPPRTHKQKQNLEQPTSPKRSPPKASTHVRAHSFSTIDDHAPRPSLEQPGTFKVVINRPTPPTTQVPAHNRKSSDALPDLPVIEVPIPHYRLGTPQFGTQGTPVMRSSMYSSSKGEQSQQGQTLRTPSALGLSLLSKRHSDAFPRPLFDRKSTAEMVGIRASVPQSIAGQSILTAASHLYDYLALNPNDPAVVRYAPNTPEIVAATPSRLVAHITSPSFLDYELLSDFFLTFRSFVQVDELVSFLISRLRWAVNRVDDFGRIVRVRTFVALRHWILNYFVDDFVPDEPLRQHFCNLVNSLYGLLRGRADGGGGDIKIIGELKKCWRRTCALHWVDSDPFARESPEDDIVPGGPRDEPLSNGSSTPTVPPVVHEPTKAPKEVTSTTAHTKKPSTVKSTETPKAKQHGQHPSVASTPHSYPYSGPAGTFTERGVPISPESEQSANVLSCSIPVKPIYRGERGAEIPLFPHPVRAPVLTITSSPTTSKPPNPLQSNMRVGSFYDPLDLGRKTPSLLLPPSGDAFELPAIYVIPGSLVRGVLFQPESPYFDIRSSGSLRRNKATFQTETLEVPGFQHARNQQQPNPGVKKLFGSVRRALGSRQTGQPSDTSAQSSAGNLLSPTPPVSEIPAGVSHSRKGSQRSRTQVRIDLLAAKVEETFREAVEAGMEEDRAIERDILAFTKNRGSDNDTTPRTRDPRFDRSVTIGSRSIVIMDDTNPELYMMSGALNPPSNPASHGTRSFYEEYVADATRHFRGQKPRRNTVSSIDSVMTGRRLQTLSPGAAPAVYIPTGFQKPTKGTKDTSEAKESPIVAVPRHMSRQRFSNSLRSSFSATPSLRKYSSYHSGDTTSRFKRSVQAGPSTEAVTKSTDGDDFVLGKPPVRQLRRRPGGDLKAVTNVHDLETTQPPQAVASSPISLIQPSVDSITLATTPIPQQEADANPATTPKKRRRKRHDGDESTDKRSISLIETHSSQPNLRPSFEAEVAKLAALPDDELDDGGIEAALLKLEGKYEKKTPLPSPEKSDFDPILLVSPVKSEFSAHSDWLSGEGEHSRKLRHHKEHVQDIVEHPVSPVSPEPFQTRSIHRVSCSSDVAMPLHLLASQNSVVDSEASYNSIPLLERSYSGPSVPRPRLLERLIVQDSNSAKSKKGLKNEPESANSSIEHVIETDSMRRIPKGDTVPRSPTMHESFLLDDTLELSDGYNGLYDEASDAESQGVRSFFDDEAFESEHPDKPSFSHPLRHPDTPPVAPPKEPRKTTPPTTTNPTTFNQGLPTPGLTPVAKLPLQSALPTTPIAREHKRAKPSEISHPAAHLPFILAFDAEILAQQFTIIEKDALDEIDWRELIELRWKQTSPSVRDWVEYLRTQDPRGVDLVIARFNLVVKWIVSEIVLTEIQDERVKCIVQYIHIASHCRRLRNYATMYQITIALLSADCSRLKSTWEDVPAPEMKVFTELEQVVQPTRNFHNLRVEMETGMGDDGCIPFIGIYTRDLVYNAQKPPYITTPPLNPNEPLVNFERHHTAATIVKSLLRLLEASSRYQFNAEPGIIGKCLWMATLPDEEITARSKKLE